MEGNCDPMPEDSGTSDEGLALDDGSKMIKAYLETEFAGSFIRVTVESENKLKVVLPMEMSNFSELILELAEKFEAVCELGHDEDSDAPILTVWHSFDPAAALVPQESKAYTWAVLGLFILLAIAWQLHSVH